MFVCSNCKNPEHIHKDQTEADNKNIMINKSKK